MLRFVVLTPLFIALSAAACESSPKATEGPLGAAGAGDADGAGTAGEASSAMGGGSSEDSTPAEGGAARVGASGAPDGSAEAGAATGGQGPKPSEVALIPHDGWIDGSGNALGVQGAAYAEADPVTAETLEVDVEGSHLCMRGAAAAVDVQCTPVAPAGDCFEQFWGAGLGVNLNQSDAQARLLPYDASAFAGFSFDLVGPNVPTNVRFSVETSDGTSYCLRPREATREASWDVGVDDLVPQCHQPDPTAPNASSVKPQFTALRWTVIGNTDNGVAFDFCVENLRVKLD
jgi:hypothetical protein